MRRTKDIAGRAIIVTGVLIVLFPFMSLWRLSGQVLTVLPDVEAAHVDDDRHRFAIFDSDFTLATRTYVASPVSDVERTLRDGGFDTSGSPDYRLFFRDCCGSYDAVFVTLEETDPQTTVATITVYDADIQATWPFVSAFGFLIVFAGAAIARETSRRSIHPTPAVPLSRDSSPTH